jgi:prepilin-type N-terminal cleavage/methylation domain-containing protein
MRLRRHLRREGGFTIPEVLVAIVLLATGAVAVMGVVDASTRNTYRAEQTQVAINRAQDELEALRQLDYSQVALTSTPTHATDPNDPRYRVSGSNFDTDRDPAVTNNSEMVVNGVSGVTGGTIAPGPTPFTSGDVHGQVFRFVVWQNDPNCLVVCPGTHDYKRVIVAVTIDNAPVSFTRSYSEVQSNFIDPNSSILDSGVSGGTGSLVTAQQFYLTDTTCNQASPVVPSATHLSHNTLGTCSDANKPDGLYTSAPTDPDPADPANPGLFDYADDPALEPQPNNDAGLQLLRQDNNNCDYTGGASNPQWKVHRWVTAPMPLAFVMSGQATLEFFTKTIGDVNIPGEVCVFLFTRTEVTVLGVTTATDTRLVNLDSPPNAFFSYAESPWPRYQWTRRRLVMNFAPTTLLLGQRLGVALAVRRNGTPQDALEFMYDHPDYATRLEVRTTTPLP